MVSDTSSTIHQRNADQVTEARFRVPPTILSSTSDYDNESFLSTIMNLIDNFVPFGSGWKVDHVMSLSISFAPDARQFIYSNSNRVNKETSCSEYSNLDDNYCILYAILAHIHPLTSVDNPTRPQKCIRFLSKLNYEGLEFP